MKRWRRSPRLPAIVATAALLLVPLALSAQPVPTGVPLYPLGSRLGLIPPPGIEVSHEFPGFEDRANHVYIRLVSMPQQAFAEIEQTMSKDALLKQGLVMEKREDFSLAGAKGILMVAAQQVDGISLHKWMAMAPVGDFTVLVSFEIPDAAKDRYPEPLIRAALASTAVRAVPPEEMLQLMPFRVTELAGFRVANAIPGVAVQLTEGPNDTLGSDQPQLIITAAPGGPEPRDRDNFARMVLTGLPPLTEMHITGSEPLRIGGLPGHELRAEGKDKDGHDIRIIQWLRFGTGGYVQLIGFAKADGWLDVFMRFRKVRDGVMPR